MVVGRDPSRGHSLRIVSIIDVFTLPNSLQLVPTLYRYNVVVVNTFQEFPAIREILLTTLLQ